MKNYINLCAFNEIDVLSVDVPLFPFPQLPLIVSRAKRILSKRSQQEITDASKTLAWMINQYFQEQEEQNQFRAVIVSEFKCAPIRIRDGVAIAPQGTSPLDDIEKFLSDYPCPSNTSELTALQACIDDFDISNSRFQDALKQEYFAVLALWLVVDCLVWSTMDGELRQKPTPNNVDISVMRTNNTLYTDRLEMAYAGIIANEATSTINYAEYLRSKRNSQS